MYNVICQGKNSDLYEVIRDFKTRKDARIFIKYHKKRDKEYFNKHGLYCKYKIVKNK